MKRILLGSLLLAGLTACAKTKEASFPIPTAAVRRLDFTVNAEATGKIEPINVVDIKSKAGGQIIKMPVESGYHVMKGDTIVDLDKRDVQSSYEQAKADFDIAVKRLDNSNTVNERNQEMFKAGVITRAEKESGELDIQSQATNVLKTTQALEIARLRLVDATIVAPQEGTILDKKVSVGTVIASASNSASGGTTLVTMADLTHVRARVLVSETDIGKVMQGMTTTVLVDAYPNRPFEGVVEKMEPQAVVDQNVTMFPVLVNLDNTEGALMPGMNGEVSILVDQKRNVLAIPLDAFRLSNEARTVAEMFGSTPEKVDSVAAAGQRAPRTVVPVADDSATQVPVGRGDPSSAGRGRDQQGGGQGGQNSGRGGQGGSRGGRGGLPTVTDGDCNAVTAALAKKAGVQDQIDSLNAARATRGADFTAIGNQMNAIYASAGVNPQVAAACRARSFGNGRGGNSTGGRGGGRAGRGGGRGGGAGGAGAALGNLGTRNQGLGVRGQGLASAGIVFVQVGVDTTVKPPKAKFEPRFVRLGAQNYDVAEVTDGLKEGEVVALMAAAKIEVQRRAAAEKQKANTSLIPGMGTGGRGMPGMGGDRGPGGGGPGGAGAGGGAGGGGGGRGRGGD